MKPHDDEFDDAAAGEDEVLVAYLDGQLTSDECEHIESLLATDTTTRQRLQAFDRVWNALDALPRSTASPSFTRTTIDMAAVTSNEQRGANRRVWRWRVPLWALASMLGLLVGVVLTFAAVTAPERRAVLDLPIALHASALEQAGTLEFLTKLADTHAEDLAVFRDSKVRNTADEWATVAAASPPQRHAWVEGLAPAELTAVNARVAEFQARPAAKQASLQRFAEDLASHPNAKELRETALAYEAMVRRLPASEQASLRQMSVEERLRVIDRQATRWARDAQLDLNGAEVAAFRDAIDRLTRDDSYKAVGDQIIEALRQSVSRRGAEQFAERIERGFRDALERDPKLLLIGTTTQIAGRGGRRGPFDRWLVDMSRAPGAEGLQGAVRESWRGWVTQLQRSLPEEAADALRGAEDDPERARRLSHLLRQTQVEDDLPTAFARLDPAEMDSLLLQPTDEFRDALSGPDMRDAAFPPGFDWRGGPPPLDGPPPNGGRPFLQRPRDFGRRPGVGFEGPPPGGPPPGPPPRD